MTARWRALIYVLGAAMCKPSCSLAGVWGADPKIGIVGDYSTNAELLDLPHTAADRRGAAARCADDLQRRRLRAVRLAQLSLQQQHGLLIGHLGLRPPQHKKRVPHRAQHRDHQRRRRARLEPLLRLPLQRFRGRSARFVDGGSELGSIIDRTHRFRHGRQLDAGPLYGEAVGIPTLTDFKYTSISPTVAWNSSEQNKLTASASVGRYDSLDGTT